MRFLVRINVHLPPALDPSERELHAAGAIVEIWRIPGGVRNVGIWEAADATELHAAISSLPLYPYLDADVTALARHPITGG